MARQHRGNGQLIGGIVLVAVGAMFLLDRFWFFDMGRIVSRFWPSMLILIGVMQLTGGRARSWTGPLVLITMGVIFQAWRLDLFHWMGRRELWPMLLIGIGIAMLADRLRSMGGASQPPPYAGHDGPPQSPQP